MTPKKLVCYYSYSKDPTLTSNDIKFIMEALINFNEGERPVIMLPDKFKLEYLDAFSLRKFVKNTAMKLKLRFGK